MLFSSGSRLPNHGSTCQCQGNQVAQASTHWRSDCAFQSSKVPVDGFLWAGGRVEVCRGRSGPSVRNRQEHVHCRTPPGLVGPLASARQRWPLISGIRRGVPSTKAPIQKRESRVQEPGRRTAGQASRGFIALHFASLRIGSSACLVPCACACAFQGSQLALAPPKKADD